MNLQARELRRKVGIRTMIRRHHKKMKEVEEKKQEAIAEKGQVMEVMEE